MIALRQNLAEAAQEHRQHRNIRPAAGDMADAALEGLAHFRLAA